MAFLAMDFPSPADMGPFTIVPESTHPSSSTSINNSASRSSNLGSRLSFLQRLTRSFILGWRRSPTATITFLTFLFFTIFKFTATTIVLGINYQAECDRPLWSFLLMLDIITFMKIPFLTLEAFWMFPLGVDFYATPRGQFITSSRDILATSQLLMFFLGSVWVLSSKTCSTTAPSLYIAAFAWVIYASFLLFFPLVLCFLVIFCLPVAILIIRNRNGFAADPFGTSTRARGLSSDRIAMIPTEVYTKNSIPESPSNGTINSEDGYPRSSGSLLLGGRARNNSSRDVCAICLSPYDNNNILRCLPCQHRFHIECIDSWLSVSATCPLCVRRMDEDEGGRRDHPAQSTEQTSNSMLVSPSIIVSYSSIV